MSNHNEDSLEPQYSPTLTRSNAGNRTREEERAITEHQVRGTHWTDEGTRRSTRTSGSRGATPVHRVVHDSEKESTSSASTERDSTDMDGPTIKDREPSDSSDLSLPPHSSRNQQAGHLRSGHRAQEMSHHKQMTLRKDSLINHKLSSVPSCPIQCHMYNRLLALICNNQP